MLFPTDTLHGIETGTTTLAFRRWTRPRVRPGTQLRTLIGLVEVTSVDVLTAEAVSADDARLAGFASREDLLAFLGRRPEGEIYRIGVRHTGPDPRIALREESSLSPDELADIVGRLRRMDRAARRGPWTARLLRLVAQWPAVRAPDLAARIGWESEPFKRSVRRLKELGLTESLGTGYRISPRGQVVLDVLSAHDNGSDAVPDPVPDAERPEPDLQ